MSDNTTFELDVNSHDMKAITHAQSLYDKNRLEESANILVPIINSSDNPDALYLLGNIMLKTGNYKNADSLLSKALSIWNAFSENSENINIKRSNAYMSIGAIFQQQGNNESAYKCYQISLEINPQQDAAYSNMGSLFLDNSIFPQAIKMFEKSLEIKPQNTWTLFNIASAYSASQRYDLAIKHLQKAITLEPEFIKAKINLAFAYYHIGKQNEAVAIFQDLIKNNNIDSNTKNEIKVNMMLMIPQIMESNAEINTCRKKLSNDIDKLTAENFTIDKIEKNISLTSFPIAYHGRNDDIILQNKIADFFEKICPSLLYKAKHCHNKITSEKKKIGFVSHYFFDHSVGRSFNSIIEKISEKNEFEIFIFSTANINYRGKAKYFQLPSSLSESRNLIAQNEIDILIYTDIGMNSFTYFLAFARCAPVQGVMAGHPITTGIKNIDYFISHIHGDTNSSHYSEKLIELAYPPVYYQKTPMPDKLKSKKDLGFSEDKNTYICPMLMHKLHPDFDDIMTSILQKDKKAEIILFKIAEKQWDKTLRQRLKKSMPDLENRVRFLDCFGKDDFVQALLLADSVLDSNHFGGGTTNYIAFSIGVPIVTIPSGYLRGNGAYALYNFMNVKDLIANDNNDYVDKAIKIANDKNYKKMISDKIILNNNVIFENNQAVEALNDFFKEVKWQ